jgi:hypothetical protein
MQKLSLVRETLVHLSDSETLMAQGGDANPGIIKQATGTCGSHCDFTCLLSWANTCGCPKV